MVAKLTGKVLNCLPMDSDTQRSKTTREREIDELLKRSGHDETAWELQHRMRTLNNYGMADVAFKLRELTGASVSVKSMRIWWDTDDSETSE